MTEYTVVLRVPEDEADDWPNDMYVADVAGISLWEATLRAQTQAANMFNEKYESQDDIEVDPESFQLLLITPRTTVLRRGDLT